MSAVQTEPGSAPSTSDAKNPGLLRRASRSASAALAMGWLGIVVVASALAPWLSPFDPAKPDIENILAMPSGSHLLGTDSAGRDVLSRILYGTRSSLLGVLLCVAIAATLGVFGGLLAGYRDGRLSGVLSWTSALLQASPAIVILLAVRSAFGSSIWLAMIVFGVIIAPAFFRLVSVTVRGVRNELYIDAAKVSGLSERRIIGRHILGVVRAPIVIQTAIVASIALGVQAGLAILGFGDTEAVTLGSVLNDGFAKIYVQGWLLLWPSFVLATITLSLVVLANAMRDALEGPRVVQTKTPTLPDNADLASLDPPIVHAAANEDQPSGPPLLSIRDLVVGYPDPNNDIGWSRVVRSVSLDVVAGEVMGLVGESGSGKTQTALAVLGLLPSGGRVLNGSILLDGVDLATLSQAALDEVRGRRISYVPQEPMSNLDPSFTIGSQLVEPLRNNLNLSKAQARTRALDLLARVGIPDPKRTFAAYPHELSGGMAQRALVAGAVSCEPDLIIADEPTTALDVTVQADLLELLRSLQQELHTALLLVTHNFGVVADLCDRVAVMQSGRIIETGSVREIFHQPQHEYTKALLGAILEDAPARSPYRATAPAEGKRR
jgi:peptide/nickel transport system permease protein